ncbi:MAG: DUF2975 domain-containing protein [Telmatospirillum sp.]|nr:DUF2975 domain-containing protein [Telmatospirillum sp.]
MFSLSFPGPASLASRKERQDKLNRLSRFAEWLALGGMVLVTVCAGLIPFDRDILVDYLSHEVQGSFTMPSDKGLFAAYAISMIPLSVFVAALWEARQFFRLLRRAGIFDPRSPAMLVRLGWLAIVIAVSSIVTRTLVILVMTYSSPTGSRQISVGIDPTDVGSLVVGLLLLVFALVMQEALVIEDENRSII